MKGFGPVRGIIGSLPTDSGFIQISCQSRGSDFEGYLPLFEAIIRNTKLDAELKYRPNGKGAGWGGWKWALAAMALLGGAAALVVGLLRRKKVRVD